MDMKNGPAIDQIGDYTDEGRKALAAGNINLALNKLFAAVRVKPSEELWLLIADCYEQLGRGNIALIYLSRGLLDQGSSSDPVRKAKLEDLKLGALEANPGVIEFRKKLAKSSKDHKSNKERAQFHKYLSQGRVRDAYMIGKTQLEARRLDKSILNVWCSLAARQGDIQTALIAGYTAILEVPHDWCALTNMGDILGQLKKSRAALDHSLAAVNLNPSLSTAWINLSAAFENLGQHWEAVKACREALKISPNEGLAWNNLGNSLKNSGQSSEAVKAFREAIRFEPDNMALWSNLLFGILYDENATQEQIAQEHFRFGEYIENKFKVIPHKSLKTNRIPDKINIGFVSADLRSHPVAYFVEPLLDHLDRSKFNVVVYDNFPWPDPITERLQGYDLTWRSIATLKDEQVVNLIRGDKIDVLVDLSGHTARNRLTVFAQRPAPVQVTWLGHPATSGLKRIDWRLTDAYIDPEGSDQFYSEKLWRLPFGACYRPLIKDPSLRFDPHFAVRPTPALLNGYVTFGSCNNLAKVNENVVECWAGILKSVPNSKLLIESPGLGQLEFQSRVRASFEAQGVAPDRLLLFPREPKLQYLRYHDIDIALDPFPYGGGTTTSDLLWMGLPMVTLVGERVMARSGFSVLSVLDKSEWVARTTDEYQAIAVSLASDIGRLNRTRHQMRPLFESSVIMDEQRFTAEFSEAVVKMYALAAKSVS